MCLIIGAVSCGVQVSDRIHLTPPALVQADKTPVP